MLSSTEHTQPTRLAKYKCFGRRKSMRPSRQPQILATTQMLSCTLRISPRPQLPATTSLCSIHPAPARPLAFDHWSPYHRKIVGNRISPVCQSRPPPRATALSPLPHSTVPCCLADARLLHTTVPYCRSRPQPRVSALSYCANEHLHKAQLPASCPVCCRTP